MLLFNFSISTARVLDFQKTLLCLPEPVPSEWMFTSILTGNTCNPNSRIRSCCRKPPALCNYCVLYTKLVSSLRERAGRSRGCPQVSQLATSLGGGLRLLTLSSSSASWLRETSSCFCSCAGQSRVQQERSSCCSAVLYRCFSAACSKTISSSASLNGPKIGSCQQEK